VVALIAAIVMPDTRRHGLMSDEETGTLYD
jgi:hypothetical protein